MEEKGKKMIGRPRARYRAGAVAGRGKGGMIELVQR